MAVDYEQAHVELRASFDKHAGDLINEAHKLFELWDGVITIQFNGIRKNVPPKQANVRVVNARYIVDGEIVP